MDDLRLTPEELYWRCDPAQFEFTTTRDLPPLEGPIGQDRALTAIDFGLGIKAGGFNLFILGQPGTGRSSTIKKLLRNRAKSRPVPDDWCYVHDFAEGTRPEYIRLPAGAGVEFKKDVDHLVERLAEELPSIFESKEYEEQKNQIAAAFQEQKGTLLEQLEKEANAKGFVLQKRMSGFVILPVRKGEPLTQEEYEALSDKEKAKLEEAGGKLQGRINEVVHQLRKIDEELRDKTVEMEKKVLLYAIGHLFEGLEQKYRSFAQIIEHLQKCKRDIVNRLDELRPQKGLKLALPGMQAQQEEPSFSRYQVNLFIDNSTLDGAPVVYEGNPTYFNVFGRIEHIIQMGSAVTNFQMIKAGAIHRANGGYLILDCREVLFNIFTYEALKRCIRNREVKIEDFAEQFRLIATVSLKPQPIPLDCKVVLIGTPLFYYLLYAYDPDFRKYFKVKVDFDHMMSNTWENVQQFALFIGAKCSEENLLHFDPGAVARLVEYAARLSGDQKHFSSSFIDIADLIREAAFFAEKEAADRVVDRHVELALEARVYRSNRLEERLQELIDDGTILIDTCGAVTGQVNGLSVYQLGDFSFGKPSRVTVRTCLGRGGVINIEREAKLSGPIHDKGVMILGGFFGERYGRDKPLMVSASICFEQSYGGVEGDSASSTELYALLSSLAELPVSQGIAVTGSVNQHGQVQPIGGVNEKIEGFYATCKARGLTGDQGVIIPAANRKNLMLKPEVITAVRAGTFHIWAVSHVDQGIAILTGVPAGDRQEDGNWSEDSVNGRIDRRLHDLAEIASRYGESAVVEVSAESEEGEEEDDANGTPADKG
jgi:lon-related putative ATP-dependent protease